MVRRKLSFHLQVKRPSLFSVLKLAISFPKGSSKDLPHLPPYPSTPPPFISPSPYPSFPILLHPLFFLPPTLIPPHIPPPTALHHLPTTGLHSKLHLEGSSHSLCCHAFPLLILICFLILILKIL